MSYGSKAGLLSRPEKKRIKTTEKERNKCKRICTKLWRLLDQEQGELSRKEEVVVDMFNVSQQAPVKTQDKKIYDEGRRERRKEKI